MVKNILRIKHRIKQYFLRREIRISDRNWKLVTDAFLEAFAEEINELLEEKPTTHNSIVIASSRLDYPNHVDRSIIESYFIDLAKEAGAKLKDEEIMEFWQESVAEVLREKDLDLQWDSDDLYYEIYNPAMMYCDNCNKFVEWDDGEDSQFECPICKNEIPYD